MYALKQYRAYIKSQKGRRTKCYSKYPFIPLYKYIPKRYDNLADWQQQTRNRVDNIKNGIISSDDMSNFKRVVQKIVADNEAQWIITFVPPTFDLEYDIRWKSLSDYLIQNATIPVAYRGIQVYRELGFPKHSGGDYQSTESENLFVDKEQFQNKNVILIDDVITTGRTFSTVGDTLMENGAKKIQGIVFAMTIHPNLPVKKTNSGKRKDW